MSLLQSIQQAKEFGIWLHESTNNREHRGQIRERTGEAVLQLSLDLADAILVLLENRLPGPALTLARPLFETYVHGFWLLRCVTDEQIENFNDRRVPKFSSILKDIGKDEASGAAWIHATEKANWTSFNDLTHGGSEHVRRRITPDAVEPNYPEQELENLVCLGIEVRIRIGWELFVLMNDERGKQQLEEKAKEHRVSLNKASQP